MGLAASFSGRAGKTTNPDIGPVIAQTYARSAKPGPTPLVIPDLIRYPAFFFSGTEVSSTTRSLGGYCTCHRTPPQQLVEAGDELLVQFHSGGLFELANHLFSWAGDVVIEQPDGLKQVIEELLVAAGSMLRPDLSQQPVKE